MVQLHFTGKKAWEVFIFTWGTSTWILHANIWSMKKPVNKDVWAPSPRNLWGARPFHPDLFVFPTLSGTEPRYSKDIHRVIVNKESNRKDTGMKRDGKNKPRTTETRRSKSQRESNAVHMCWWLTPSLSSSTPTTKNNPGNASPNHVNYTRNAGSKILVWWIGVFADMCMAMGIFRRLVSGSTTGRIVYMDMGTDTREHRDQRDQAHQAHQGHWKDLRYFLWNQFNVFGHDYTLWAWTKSVLTLYW